MSYTTPAVSKFDFEKLRPTPVSIVMYKKGPYYHFVYGWILEDIGIDPIEYSYLLRDLKFLPDTECQEVPCGCPIPCSCLALSFWGISCIW